MKILVLCEYPPLPAGLSTQADLLVRGLRHLGVDVQAVHLESPLEKEWYYRWYAPDLVVGVGYWGYAPNLILDPLRFGMLPVPWLVADGYIANYLEVLNSLPLILLTSNWVREVYIRDGVKADILEVLPVGCDTDAFHPRAMTEDKVAIVREALGVAPDQLLLFTIGGDAASKGAQETMKALAQIKGRIPSWKYVCKVWPQPRTDSQNIADHELVASLGLEEHIIYTTGKISRALMPYLMAACDIYIGPSRLEGFGMPHVEAGACGKPVLAIDAMAFRDTMVHGRTALLARVAQENRLFETVLGDDAGERAGERVIFDPPRIADYRASVTDIAEHLLALMNDPGLRTRLGENARTWVTERFDYRVVAQQFVEIISRCLAGFTGTALLDAYRKMPVSQSLTVPSGEGTTSKSPPAALPHASPHE